MDLTTLAATITALGVVFGAIFAAYNGNEVHIFEKNEKLGKKLFITGKGRCNITNSADIDEFIGNVPTNGKFLYSAFYSFTNDDIIKGIRCKKEYYLQNQAIYHRSLPNRIYHQLPNLPNGIL